MTMPEVRRGLLLMCVVLLPLFLGGCVERTLMIRSDPPGAQVIVNGVDLGPAPVTLPFQTYGVYDVVLSRPDHHRLRATVPIKPPWYEHVPLDFCAEVLWPFTLRDCHDVTLSMQPIAPADEAGVDEREAQLRQRLENPGE